MTDKYLHLDAQFVKAEIAKLIEAEGAQRELARFWSKVELPHHTKKDACWVWRGSLGAKGYGMFKRDRVLVAAHRYSYTLICGEVASDVQVCHSCDNPGCVRPSHLFPGTNADNMADRESKGRGVRQSGETHPLAKLAAWEVEAIRYEYRNTDANQRVLAKRFGVSQHTIWSILNDRTRVSA